MPSWPTAPLPAPPPTCGPACLQNVIAWGIPEEAAIRAASLNPACAIGADKEVGSIETGKIADFVVCSPDYKEKTVYLAGEKL